MSIFRLAYSEYTYHLADTRYIHTRTNSGRARQRGRDDVYHERRPKRGDKHTNQAAKRAR